MSETISKIRNPETGKLINVDGPTYQQLLAKGYNLSQIEEVQGKKGSKRYQESVPSLAAVSEIRQLPSKFSSKQSNSAKGWEKDGPKRGQQRRDLMEKCGNRCFLIPEQQSFPICSACRTDECLCELDCRGLAAANIRARQWQYTNLYQTIDDLGKTKCGW